MYPRLDLLARRPSITSLPSTEVTTSRRRGVLFLIEIEYLTPRPPTTYLRPLTHTVGRTRPPARRVTVTLALGLGRGRWMIGPQRLHAAPDETDAGETGKVRVERRSARVFMAGSFVRQPYLITDEVAGGSEAKIKNG